MTANLEKREALLPKIEALIPFTDAKVAKNEFRELMREWEKRFPGRVDNIFASLARVTPSHLMDRSLFDFASAIADGTPPAEGDIAFDVDPQFEQAQDPGPTARIDVSRLARD